LEDNDDKGDLEGRRNSLKCEAAAPESAKARATCTERDATRLQDGNRSGHDPFGGQLAGAKAAPRSRSVQSRSVIQTGAWSLAFSRPR
jgi:hypothetical protein